MEFLIKFKDVLLLLGFIYVWNRYLIKHMIKSVVDFHKKNNSKNLDKQPTKFLIQNEKNVHIVYSAFFWFGALVISYGILFD